MTLVGEFVDGVSRSVHLQAGECVLLLRGTPLRLAGTQDCATVSYTGVQAVRCGTIASYTGGGQCLLVGALRLQRNTGRHAPQPAAAHGASYQRG